jgi:hypothetical protein
MQAAERHGARFQSNFEFRGGMMGIFDAISNALSSALKRDSSNNSPEPISYGGRKADGSHDHRTNRDGDRTPAQKQGDVKRRK